MPLSRGRRNVEVYAVLHARRISRPYLPVKQLVLHKDRAIVYRQ